MIERLEIINKRYEELNKQLLDPENLSNIKLTREISKEISDLEDTINCYKKYKKVLDDLEESKEMLKDPELAEFAKEEIPALESEKEALEKEDLEDIKSKKEKLNETAMAFATKVYEEADKKAQEEQAKDSKDDNKDSDVKEAEFEEK